MSILAFLSFPLLLHTTFATIPNPDPAVQPFLATPFTPPKPTTIPAFPEQSSVAGCPLDLPEELFHGIKTACGSGSGQLHRSRCCPVLAAWLYTAYSATALQGGGGGSRISPAVVAGGGRSNVYDPPLLPDDSETCVDNLGKALKVRGIELVMPNKTCDLVYCYCGIRLHPFSCSEAFSVNERGKLVGNRSVKRLEKACLSSSRFPAGLGGCSECLNTLYTLNKNPLNLSKSEDTRNSRMHDKDCQLMGLTWLLAKNQTAYIHTASSVLRAMMMSRDGSDPRSCTLDNNGMPLAVDSADFSDRSSSTTLLQPPIHVLIASVILLLYMDLILVST